MIDQQTSEYWKKITVNIKTFPPRTFFNRNMPHPTFISRNMACPFVSVVHGPSSKHNKLHTPALILDVHSLKDLLTIFGIYGWFSLCASKREFWQRVFFYHSSSYIMRFTNFSTLKKAFLANFLLTQRTVIRTFGLKIGQWVQWLSLSLKPFQWEAKFGREKWRKSGFAKLLREELKNCGNMADQ